MLPTLSALTLTLLSQVTLTPASVPAIGRQETLMRVTTPGMVHVSARGPSGTTCTLVDRVRGPFVSAGVLGKTNCELDVLLDAGEYKVRLESPLKGRGQVALSATPFTELNATPVELINGAAVQTSLALQQSASFWVRLGTAATPYVHVVGRTAGDVSVWRNGTWLEPVSLTHSQRTLSGTTTVHDWWLETQLEAGDYRIVVSGMNPSGRTVDSNDTRLTITAGFIAAPAERVVSFTLDPSGSAAVELPPENTIVMATNEGADNSQITLGLHEWNGNGPRGSARTCTAMPQCALFARRAERRVAFVTGAPGTPVTLEWPNNSDALSWESSSNATFNILASGRRTVSLGEYPVQADSGPLGCRLETVNDEGDARPVAFQASKVGDGLALQRSFNFTGLNQQFWFEVTSSGRYRIKTGGERKNRCDVYRFEKDGTTNRVTRTAGTEQTCDQRLDLATGVYMVQLLDGLSGIDTLSINEESSSIFKKKTVTTTGLDTCRFDALALERGRYRFTTTRPASVMNLDWPALPLVATMPMHVQLEPGTSLVVPLQAGRSRRVRAVGGTVGCALKRVSTSMRDGVCQIPALSNEDTLTLSNPGATMVRVSISPEIALPPAQAMRPFTLGREPIATLTAGTQAFFDFARNESHSVIFDVTTPGLYSVTTQGLLATSCMLRTPVAPAFANNEGAGRGRNCLIATSLQKGRYMMTATTQGQSVGRASLLMTRRPAKDMPAQNGEGDTFFRVAADELAQQTLTVPSNGQWRLTTSGQGQSLECRLDDAQGWPLEPVPSNCNATRTLAPGKYLWSQMPLTVESMRHTEFKKVRDEVVLKGNTAHPIDFFTWYRAELGADGQDELTFSLTGDTTIDVVMTSGMQGRLYRVEGKELKPVDVIPPSEMSAAERGSTEENASESGEQASEGSGEEGESGDESEDGESSDGEGSRRPAPVQQPVVTEAPPPPHGTQLSLTAGTYRLIAQHSRGDTGISYRLHLGALTLLPGMTREAPVPSTLPIVLPRAGTLRLSTRGDSDVRCRLLNADGVTVAESGDNGADWNCAIAEPMAAGSYTLRIDSEVQQPGQTTVSLAVPPIEDRGALTNGATVTLGSGVSTWALSADSDDTLLDLQLTSNSGTFSCAVENEVGVIEGRQLRTRTCALLVRPGRHTSHLQVWSNQGTPALKVAFATRTQKPVSLTTAGRYALSGPASCINGSAFGVLSPCWPEVSLEAGSTVFATAGSASTPSASEVNATPADTAQQVTLGRTPFIQRISTGQPSLFTLEASVPHGSASSIGCAFDGVPLGRESRARECFAVSGAATEATGRVFSADAQNLAVTLVRRAITLPSTAEALSTGRRHVSFKTAQAFTVTPLAARVRIELTLPAKTWAVLLDAKDQPSDACAPRDSLSTCRLTSGAGRLILSGAQGEAELNVTQLEAEPRTTKFSTLLELDLRQPGTLRLPFEASAVERRLSVEGALSCTVILDTGAQVNSCRTAIKAQRQGTLVIGHEVGPVRAVLAEAKRALSAQLGLDVPLVPGATLAPSVATPLAGARIDRTLVVSSDAVVHLSASSGVCGLFKGPELIAVDGFKRGCSLVRVLSAGQYRVVVRPFGEVPLNGTLTWSSETPITLTEGIGAQSWVAPGEVKVFRFSTAADGKVGLGVQAGADTLDCRVLTERDEVLGEGCQQYLSLKKGPYLLVVSQPGSAQGPMNFKPVLLGLAGDSSAVPPEYLKDFFNRIGSK